MRGCSWFDCIASVADLQFQLGKNKAWLNANIVYLDARRIRIFKREKQNDGHKNRSALHKEIVSVDAFYTVWLHVRA